MIDVRRLVIEFSINDDQRAFAKFFDHFYPRLLNFAFFIVKSGILAEEVVSDVFVKIWKNRNRILEVDNINTYMFTSVRNQSYSYLKKQKLDVVPFDKLPEYSFINKSNPESELLDKELILKMQEAIQKLPPKCQMIFHLSRDEGFTYEEVAKILEISKSTVKNQMTIALKKIKEDFASYFEKNND